MPTSRCSFRNGSGFDGNVGNSVRLYCFGYPSLGLGKRDITGHNAECLVGASYAGFSRCSCLFFPVLWPYKRTICCQSYRIGGVG